MDASFFRPALEQDRDCSAIVGDERQASLCGFAQTGNIVLPEEASAFPLRKRINFESAMAATKSHRYTRRDVLIEKKLEHSVLLL